MTRIKLDFIKQYIDRHGKVRRYFRRRGYKSVPLPGVPGSAEFMAAYQLALNGGIEIAADRTVPGSFSSLAVAFYKSRFRNLDPKTQDAYRRVIESVRVKKGNLPIARLEQRHIKEMVAERSETPSAANTFLSVMRLLMRFAISEGMIDHDPTYGIRRIAITSAGFHTWSEDDIATFERRHPIGTKARLAMALMLYTGCRISDVIVLGRQHIKDGKLTYTQYKNRKRHPVTLTLAIHPELARIIDSTQSGHLTFLVTQYGKPFTRDGIGVFMRRRCNEAGLPECSAHGLRKAIARRLAESGASEKYIMAVTGHRTSKEIRRYTEAADQEHMAKAALSNLV